VQTTTEVPGGSLSATGPQMVSGPNPLGPVPVKAGMYTMTETSPSGYQLAVDCGTTSNTQPVTVPSGGAGVGIFYVEAIPGPALTTVKSVCNDSASPDDCMNPSEYFPEVTIPIGGRVVFMIAITNTGGVPLADIASQDLNPDVQDCTTFQGGVLNPGQTVSFFCGDTDNVTQSFINIAYATALTSQNVPVTSPFSNDAIVIVSNS
jgi:hypothetical protein